MSKEQSSNYDGEVFTLVDEKGNEELYKEALRFQADTNHKWYIVLYPLDEENSDEVSLQAFSFQDNGDGDDIDLLPIDNDAEWEMVQEVINTFIDDDGNFNA
ncbi:DUF1292 domain-containing protein [[Lactobacillus] timonensis]|jgi:uncharacterized protein YrzB (UPF0473 family)|uniref:DUF1292 domain-containing protein n=1 Tax=[Lactobacillus] timonensis TaxID=1970790 RepID=UPI000C83FA13|nr:DUF1292 domain-containing protein [[Lactobacillus] timonensis]